MYLLDILDDIVKMHLDLYSYWHVDSIEMYFSEYVWGNVIVCSGNLLMPPWSNPLLGPTLSEIQGVI